MAKLTRHIGTRTKQRKNKRNRRVKVVKNLVVGQFSGKLIPQGYKEIINDIGIPGQTIYEKKIDLVKLSPDELLLPEHNVKGHKNLVIPKPKKVIKEEVINNPIVKNVSSRPKVLFLCDVKGWAWWIKSNFIKKYISDEFDIDILHFIGSGRGKIDPNKYDLYFTFGYSFISKIKGSIPKNRKITGVTAHRPLNVIIPKMRIAGYVHANSILLYNELKKYNFGNRLYYLPNGVDADLFRPITSIPRKKDNIIVGHIGKLSPQKGQDDFIKPAIIKSGAESFFHFNKYTNMVKHTDMYKEYQKFDIFIVASKEDGTPNPALEAAACGRPIISNRIGNMPEFIKDGYNGFLVEKNIDAYVEKINWFRDNKDKMEEMGRNARKTILEGWTWKIQAEKYREMFKEILEI